MKIIEWITRQRDSLAEAQPSTDTEFRLVTSRRAFLGLMAASAAIAATSNPVIAALEHIAEAPLMPYTQQEGYLEVLIGDSWSTLGSISSFAFSHPTIYDVIDLAAYRGYKIPKRVSLPNFQFSIYPEEGGLAIIQQVVYGPLGRDLADYKKEFRFSNYGLIANLRGSFIQHYEAALTDGPIRVDLELCVDCYDYTATK